MILIDSILVDEEIINKKFSCNLHECKGACCTFYGEFGAPVLDDEVPKIDASINAAMKYLSKTSQKYIGNNGYIEGTKGSYSTLCIKNKDCVFVYYNKDIAYCSLERAYLDKEANFRKPLSCHLFPIRVANWNNGQLYFSEIPECEPALKKGNEEDIFLYNTVKNALIRKFGSAWYKNFVNYNKFVSNNLENEVK
jgi:hypothetical protein